VRTNSDQYTAVLNLAARAGVRGSVANPFRYLRTNAEGTLNLLELCRRFGVRKFVLASTSSLYGAHNALPFSEDGDTSRPLSPYAASKGAAESLAYTYHHLHKLDVSVLRYFTVYGPAGRPDMSVFRFIRQIAESQPITLFGNGQQKRDFTYIDDIARGTIAALKPVGFEIINLGSSHATTVALLIENLARLLGRLPIVHSREPHAADVSATLADVGKAERILNWKPQVSFDEGLERTIRWYLENRALALSLGIDD
jgi:nucleoside-diphosphate-sugar epimerase